MAQAPKAFLVRAVTFQMRRLLKPVEAANFWFQFYREELRQPGAGARLKHQSTLLAKFALFFRDHPMDSSLPWVKSVPVQIIASEDDRGFTKREIAFLSSRYPRSLTVTFPRGTGHLSFLTRSHEYVEVVRKFVAGMEARSL